MYMTFKSKKSRRNKNLFRKSIKNKKSKRNRKSIKNKRLKKYGGTQTHIFINFFGEKYYQPNYQMYISTTIGELIASKNGNLYHRGRLLSTYPLDRRVYDVLLSDNPLRPTYNIHYIAKTSEEPPKTIEIVPLTPYEYDRDPNDT